jgi:hypothetical protein
MGGCESPSYLAPLSQYGIGYWSESSELPTRGYAIYTTAESYVYYFLTQVFYAQASTNGTSSWGTTTNYPDDSEPGYCVSAGAYVYCIGGANGYGQASDAVYYAEVGAPNPNALHFENPPPYVYAQYLGPALNSCSVSAPPYGFAGAPCFTYNVDDAVVFDCAAAAATPAGCSTTVESPNNPIYNFNLTIWYPATSLAPGPPETNCAYQPEVGYSTPLYAWCISAGPDSFIISQPAPNIVPF